MGATLRFSLGFISLVYVSAMDGAIDREFCTHSHGDDSALHFVVLLAVCNLVLISQSVVGFICCLLCGLRPSCFLSVASALCI